MPITSGELEKLIPNIEGLVEPKVAREITLAFRRLYEYVDLALNEQKNNYSMALQQAQATGDFSKLLGLVGSNDGLKKTLGAFASDGYISVHDNSGHTVKILTTP